MSRHFPTLATETLTLDDGSTITVKARVTAGEQTDALGRMYLKTDDGKRPPDYNLSQVGLYLLDWHLVEDEGDPPAPAIKGRPLDEVEAVVRNLDNYTYMEIVDAIGAHAKRLDDERDAKKKSRRITSADASSSPSPSAADGTLNG